MKKMKQKLRFKLSRRLLINQSRVHNSYLIEIILYDPRELSSHPGHPISPHLIV